MSADSGCDARTVTSGRGGWNSRQPWKATSSTVRRAYTIRIPFQSGSAQPGRQRQLLASVNS